MKHDFIIVENESINLIIDKLYKTQSISIINKCKLKYYLNSFLKNKISSDLYIDDSIFRLLDPVDFNCFYNDDFKTMKHDFNYYGITIIPMQSLSIIIDAFENISLEEKQRLRNIGISGEEYQNKISNLIKKLKMASENKKNVIHFGI